MRPKKCGTYLTFTAKEKARVATYGGATSTRLVLPSNAHACCGLIIIGMVIFIGTAMQPEAIVRSCNFGCISGTKEFYDKPHVYFEDSSI